MSQEDIEQFLKEHRPNFYSTPQLAKYLSLSRSTITTNAARLLKWKHIELRVGEGNRFFYGYKPQHLNTSSDKETEYGK